MVLRELITKLGFKIDEGKLRSFNTKISKTKKKLKDTSGEFKGFNDYLKNSKIGAVAQQIPILNGVLGKLGSVAGTAGIAIAGITVAVLAVGKALVSATQKFLAFEAGMKGVQRVTLANAEDMQRLKDAALDAGEASVFSTADAANAQKFLAQAGLDVNQVIKALPGTLQLAAAAEMDLAAAADISTNILTSNRLTVEELTRVNDVLAKTASSTNTDVLQLGEAFATLGNTGALTGVEIEELSAFLGILANNGNRGSLAGTLLRNTLVDLTAPSAKGAKLMERLGIDIDNLTDSSGKFVEGALPAFFTELNVALKEGRVGAGDLMDAFGERSGRAISTFAADGGEAIEALTQKFLAAEGTAAQAASIAFQGLGGALAELRSKLDTASVRFMEDTGLSKLFEQAVRILSDVLPPLIRALATWLKPFVMVLRFAFDYLAFIFSILGGILDVITRIVQWVQDKLVWPFEYILGILEEMVNSIRTFFSDLIDLEKGPLARFIKQILSLIDSVKEFLGLTEETSKKAEESARRAAVTNSMSVTKKKTVFNVSAPITVSGAGDPNATARAVTNVFGLELQRLLIEAGGV